MRSFITTANSCERARERRGGRGDGARANASEAARESSSIYG